VPMTRRFWLPAIAMAGMCVSVSAKTQSRELWRGGWMHRQPARSKDTRRPRAWRAATPFSWSSIHGSRPTPSKYSGFGWYGGTGGRLIVPAVTRQGRVQPDPFRDAGTGLIECNWVDPYIVRTARRRPTHGSAGSISQS